MKRHAITALAAGLALLGGTAVAAPNAALAPFVARYQVNKGFVPLGTARFTLHRTAPHCYRYHYRADTSGLVSLFRSDVISETSDFCIVDGRFRSLSDRFVHTGDGKADNFALRFDWQTMTVISASGKKRHLPPHAMDRQTMQIWLRDKLEKAGKHLPKRPFPVTIVDNRHITTYRVELTGHQRLHVGAGTFQTVELDRIGGRRRMRFWLAPKLGYLPVKVEQSREGGSMPLTLQLTALPESPADGH